MTALAAPLIIAVLASCRSVAGESRQTINLEFRPSRQDIRILTLPFGNDGGTALDDTCVAFQGERRWGAIPHRAAFEDDVSTENFIHFVVAYRAEGGCVAGVDLNLDRKISCEERIPLLPHPGTPERAARTLVVNWRDEGPERSRRYRLSVPSRLSNDDRYWIELVGASFAEWLVGDARSLWLLFDGNYDGLVDGSFGDAVLVDTAGDGFNLSPAGGELFSLHLPLRLPWGVFHVADVDMTGRFVVLDRVPAGSEPLAASSPGGIVPPIECVAPGGERIRIGGESGSIQIVYFWFSGCAACHEDMEVLCAAHAQRQLPEVRFVGVSLDDTPERFASFIGEHSPSWPQCYIGQTNWDNIVAHQLGVTRPAQFVIIGPHGEYISTGRRGVKALEEATRAYRSLATHVPTS